MLGSAANFPLERLARLWLPSIIARDRDDISKIGALAELPEDAPGEFVVAALRQSRAFASLELEGILGEYRHGLLVHFSAAGERGRKKRLFLTREAAVFRWTPIVIYQDRLGTCTKRTLVCLGGGNAAGTLGNATDDDDDHHRFDSTVHPLEFAAVNKLS
jgi:hypothetical protein